MVRSLSETVPRRDAGHELTWMYLQRVSESDLTTRVRAPSVHLYNESPYSSVPIKNYLPRLAGFHQIKRRLKVINRIMMSNDRLNIQPTL